MEFKELFSKIPNVCDNPNLVPLDWVMKNESLINFADQVNDHMKNNNVNELTVIADSIEQTLFLSLTKNFIEQILSRAAKQKGNYYKEADFYLIIKITSDLKLGIGLREDPDKNMIIDFSDKRNVITYKNERMRFVLTVETFKLINCIMYKKFYR